MYFRFGEYWVHPGKETEFEVLVRRLFVDTRGLATDRVQVCLVRSITEPAHYRIAGIWKNVEQYESIGETELRQVFNEKLKGILQRPREGEVFELVAREP